MRICLPTLHVRRSAQAVALAAGNLKACLPQPLQRQTRLLDLFPEQSLEEMLRLILARRPELVAFPLYLWNREQVLELCRRLRREQPKIILLAGGPEASAEAQAVMREGELDFVICGEGEEPFRQLVETLAAGDAAQPIPGVLAASAPDRQVRAVACADLERLPSPWLSAVLPLEPGCGVLWEVARGCRFNCAFCYDAKGHRGVRPLPLKRLRAELQRFAARQVGQIWVLDSTFNAPPERGRQLLQLLLESAPQLHYHLEAKADFLDAATAELLGQLSCSVQIGLQSARPEVLKPLHRSLDRRQMARALQLLSEQGVTFGLDLIYGLPGDNHAGFCDSLDFALRQQPNQVDIFPLAVLPGTELWQQKQQYGLQAELQPPYLIAANNSYPAQELERSTQLARATDIFYNRGRAVGFFLQLCEAVTVAPSALLQQFAAWLTENGGCTRTAEQLQPAEILPLQQGFVAELLRSCGKAKLLPLAEDLLNYHFCCAELLLAEECRAAKNQPNQRQLQQQRWQLNRAVRLQRFHYLLEELEEIGGEPLERQRRLLSKEESYGIFLHQAGQPIVETIDPDFADLLQAADGSRSGAQLLGKNRQQRLPLLQFAVAQGLLLPVT